MSTKNYSSNGASAREKIDLGRFYERDVLPRVNYDSLLSALSPKRVGANCYHVTCPKCHHPEKKAYLYTDTGFIICNRTENCIYRSSLIGWIANNPHVRGKDWVMALKELCHKTGVHFPESHCEATPPTEEELAQLAEAANRRAAEQQIRIEFVNCTVRMFRDEAAKDARNYLRSEHRNYRIREDGAERDDADHLGLGFCKSIDEFAAILKKKGLDTQVAREIGLLDKRWEGFITYPWCGTEVIDIYGKRISAVETFQFRYPSKQLPYMKDVPGWVRERVELWEAYEQSERKSPWAEPRVPKTYSLRGAGSKAIPYLFHRAIRDGHMKLVVVEGTDDAGIAHCRGDTSVVAVMQAQITEAQCRVFSNYRIESVVIALDPDGAGENGTEPSVVNLASAGVRPYVMKPTTISVEGANGEAEIKKADPDEFITAKGIEAWKLMTREATHGFKWVAERIIAANITENNNDNGEITTSWSDAGKLEAQAAAVTFAASIPEKTWKDDLEQFFYDVLHKAGLDRKRVQKAAQEKCHAVTKALEPLSDGTVSKRPIDPKNFVLNDGGLHYKKWNDGEIELIWISAPIEVVAEYRNYDDDQYGVQIKFKNCDGNQVLKEIPRSVFVKNQATLLEVLADAGFDFNRKPYATELLLDYLFQSRPEHRIRGVDKIGWHGNTYVLPKGGVSASGSEDVILKKTSNAHKKFASAGTLVEWQENVAKYCVGNSRLVLAVTTALTGPLLGPLNEQSGGPHIHSGSSDSKSRAGDVGSSCWGRGGEQGYREPWNSTANALEHTLQGYNDSFICLDEIAQCPVKSIAEVCYLIGNESGKGRLTREIVQRERASWRVSVFSTGEKPIPDYLREAGLQPRAGQEVRIFDVPADPGCGFGVFEKLHGFEKSFDLTEHLKETTATYYGTAGPAWVEYIVKNKEDLLKRVAQAQKEFIEKYVPVGANGQVYRVAKRFALYAAVGEIAAEAGILPWVKDDATTGIVACFEAWIGKRGGYSSREGIEVVRRVREFLEVYGESRFEVISETGSTTTFDSEAEKKRFINERAGFRVTKGDETKWYIFRDTFKNKVCGSLDPIMAGRTLLALGYLEVDSEGKQVQKTFAGQKRNRYYCINSTIFASDEKASISNEASDKNNEDELDSQPEPTDSCEHPEDDAEDTCGTVCDLSDYL